MKQRTSNSNGENFVKNKIIMFFSFLVVAPSAFSAELGHCTYDGKTVSETVILNVCGGFGGGEKDITLTECLDKVQNIFVSVETCTRTIMNPFNGKVTEDTYPVHYKKMKYNFVGNDSKMKVSGVLQY